jgi:uncharacterized protein (TIGR03067 family)
MHLFRLPIYLAFLASTVISNIAVADESADTVDEKLLEKLQGEWEPVSSVSDGKEKQLGGEGKFSFVIEGRYMLLRRQDQQVGKFEIVYLANKDPLGHIDYEMREPRTEAVRVKQLFKLEGDKITTCVVSPPGGERPAELTSTAGSKHLLTVSERRRKK